MFEKIYSIPLYTVVAIIVGLLVVWGILGILLKRAPWRIVNTIIFIATCVGIFWFTVLDRNPGDSQEIVLTPLYSFFEAMSYSTEYYREMLMNVFLFIPFGLSFPFALPSRIRLKPLITMGTALVFSVIIEALQYAFALGRCETDDVIMNVIGAGLGTLAFVVVKAWRNSEREKES